MFSFRDSNKALKLDGDLLKRMTTFSFKVTDPNPQD